MDEETERRLDIRSAMLAAGMAIVEASGIDGPASLDTAKALVDAGVRRGSTFGKNRIWPKQWHYQVDVLKEIVEKFPSEAVLGSLEILTDNVLEQDLATPDGRAAALQLMVDHPALFSEVLKESTEWRLWNAIWACVISTPSKADDDQLGAPAQAGYDRVQATLARRYGSVLRWIGFESDTDQADEILAGIALDLILGAASTPQTARSAHMAPAVRSIVDAFYTATRPIGIAPQTAAS